MSTAIKSLVAISTCWINKRPEALLNLAIEQYGTLDYVFVNAGTIISSSIEDMDIDKMCRMLRLKVESSMRLIYSVLKHMKQENNGHLFITSSILGTKTREHAGPYAGANHALEVLAESLRMELAETNVKITCIEPGLVRTNLHRDWPVHPQQALGISHALQPQDIADTVWEVMNKPDHVRIPRVMILPQGHKI
ncbi:MAG: SDR family oxidoreductase [candidate division KSB1 bacterium]|nr:SDR family oxidoreductase [candidate division KSB1 bacterium]